MGGTGKGSACAARRKPVEGYAQPFHTSLDRAAAMLPWVTDYNGIRPHSVLGGKSPVSWLATPRAQIERMTTDTVTPDPDPDPEPDASKSATGWGNHPGSDS